MAEAFREAGPPYNLQGMDLNDLAKASKPALEILRFATEELVKKLKDTEANLNHAELTIKAMQDRHASLGFSYAGDDDKAFKYTTQHK